MRSVVSVFDARSVLSDHDPSLTTLQADNPFHHTAISVSSDVKTLITNPSLHPPMVCKPNEIGALHVIKAATVIHVPNKYGGHSSDSCSLVAQNIHNGLIRLKHKQRSHVFYCLNL